MSVRWKWVGLWAVVVVAEIAALALGDLLEDAWAIPLIALLLTFLTGGRLESRTDRLLVGLFVLATALEFVRHLFLPRDGHLLATSPPGEGTVVVAELPCGS
jgi:hypothetical protein